MDLVNDDLVSEDGGGAPVTEDPAIAAIDDLSRTIEANSRDEQCLLDELDALRSARHRGLSWRQIIGHARSARSLSLLTRVTERLVLSGGHFRRHLAHALREEGSTVESIAGAFGVSHQRVSHLLRRRPEPSSG